MKMTKEEWNKYREFVERHARERKKTLDKAYHEIDFFMGAACIYFFLKQNDQIPASWVFNPMSGDPIIDYGDKKKTEVKNEKS